jgi:hypothetical protein
MRIAVGTFRLTDILPVLLYRDAPWAFQGFRKPTSALQDVPVDLACKLLLAALILPKSFSNLRFCPEGACGAF